MAPPVLELQEQPFKAWFLDLYYGNLHMDCYRFCPQYKDYFETARVKRPNRILFAALFLRGLITQQWFQHKRRHNGATLMTWQEFKDFLQKNFEDSRTFIDGIWRKLKRDSQYQDKSVEDWAAQLNYLQFILIEFDPDCAPEERTIIWYFREGLWPSVKVKTEQRDRELNTFKEIVEKVVDAEAKAALRPCCYACDTNRHCLRGSWLSAAKTSTKSQQIKD